ncbi:MAG: DUF4286 family protein [Acetobacteraceae bacterium]
MDAAYFYIVRFWLSPDGATEVLRWLDGHHMADVLAEPGFRWLRRVRLDRDADDGWHAYMMIYGLDSREALQRYFDGPAPPRFAEERKPFQHHIRMERDWGAIDARIG